MKGRKALDALEPYVPGKSIAGGLKLSSNENPLGASPAALRAIRGLLPVSGDDRSGPPDRDHLNRYPDGGISGLRHRLAEFWDAEPDMFLVGNGSDEIMVMIAGAFIEPGTNAVTARHTFSQYTFATTIFGGRMKYSEMSEGRFVLPDIEKLVDADTRVVFLCNPNNPTGTMVNHDQLAAFMRHVPDTAAVVADEAYGEFADAPTFPDTMALLREFPNLIRLRTFSKIYGLAGLRVGYATAQSAVIDTVSKLRQPFNVGTIAQEAAVAALGDGQFVTESLENNRAGRTRVCAVLDEIGVDYFPTQANFLCAHFPPSAGPARSADAVLGALASRGIAVRPLGSFGMPEYLRISIGAPEEVAALCTALKDIAAGKPGGSG